MEGKRVTMQDIADALGISKFSVSVAISDGYGVSEDLRYRIILKAMEMGYDFGRNMRRGRSRYLCQKEITDPRTIFMKDRGRLGIPEAFFLYSENHAIVAWFNMG